MLLQKLINRNRFSGHICHSAYLTKLKKFYGISIVSFHFAAITIGFIQERYTVYEAFNATGELIPIPIIKENNQQSEITFEVISTISLGSGPTAAQPDEDFFANPPVQRQDFNPNEQEINYNFELSDDSPENPNVPEPTETFQVQLSLVDEGLPDINIGGSLFATATVVIIDDDG